MDHWYPPAPPDALHWIGQVCLSIVETCVVSVAIASGSVSAKEGATPNRTAQAKTVRRRRRRSGSFIEGGARRLGGRGSARHASTDLKGSRTSPTRQTRKPGHSARRVAGTSRIGMAGRTRPTDGNLATGRLDDLTTWTRSASRQVDKSKVRRAGTGRERGPPRARPVDHTTETTEGPARKARSEAGPSREAASIRSSWRRRVDGVLARTPRTGVGVRLGLARGGCTAAQVFGQKAVVDDIAVAAGIARFHGAHSSTKAAVVQVPSRN